MVSTDRLDRAARSRVASMLVGSDVRPTVLLVDFSVLLLCSRCIVLDVLRSFVASRSTLLGWLTSIVLGLVRRCRLELKGRSVIAIIRWLGLVIY